VFLQEEFCAYECSWWLLLVAKLYIVLSRLLPPKKVFMWFILDFTVIPWAICCGDCL